MKRIEMMKWNGLPRVFARAGLAGCMCAAFALTGCSEGEASDPDARFAIERAAEEHANVVYSVGNAGAAAVSVAEAEDAGVEETTEGVDPNLPGRSTPTASRQPEGGATAAGSGGGSGAAGAAAAETSSTAGGPVIISVTRTVH